MTTKLTWDSIESLVTYCRSLTDEACTKTWSSINSCLVCQASKYPKKRLKYPLKPLQSGELFQVDHLKLTNTEQENKGVLMMVSLFTKFALTTPYKQADARETCKLIRDHWVSPCGAPKAIQSENGPQSAASLTAEFLQLIDVIQVHSTPYHSQTNGLV